MPVAIGIFLRGADPDLTDNDDLAEKAVAVAFAFGLEDPFAFAMGRRSFPLDDLRVLILV